MLPSPPAFAYWINDGYGSGVFWGNGPYYRGPGCCYSGGLNYGWWGPSVVIAAQPPAPVYVVECETIEVCDDVTDECWLERACN